MWVYENFFNFHIISFFWLSFMILSYTLILPVLQLQTSASEMTYIVSSGALNSSHYPLPLASNTPTDDVTN